MCAMNGGVDRLGQLRHWLEKALVAGEWLTGSGFSMEPLSGDAGFRKYYRIEGVTIPLLGVDSPPETEKNEAFCHIARLLRSSGIHTPQVFAVDYDSGFMLIEDMGDNLYEEGLLAGMVNELMAESLECLHLLHKIEPGEAGLEDYDSEKLLAEMDLFPTWFLEGLLGMSLSGSEHKQLNQQFNFLAANALEQPRVVVHRDFHCRNLLRTSSASPGVIDFQDGVTGALTYDLVSLLKDCYFLLDTSTRYQWLEAFFKESDIAKRTGVGINTLERWFDLMGLQRHLKVLGIFARLFLRDNKSRYLADLPLVLHYTVEAAAKYPECAFLSDWFESSILPRAKEQDWYVPVKVKGADL
jgi:aminoglycoside/choline kinase family phosphotransferase